MYKGIDKYFLNPELYALHKERNISSDFGLDNTKELIDGGFGLYSSANTLQNIGPIKSQYFRIALIRSGTATFTIGLESFHPQRDYIVFGFPGQIFSLQHPEDEFFVYYMLFTEQFISDTLLAKDYHTQFPFLTYAGIPCFPLKKEQADEIEEVIFKMNTEIKSRKPGVGQALKIYIQLILLLANREYSNQWLSRQHITDNPRILFTTFLKLVSEHFIQHRKVADYANMLHISADHLNRIIKSTSGKTAHEFIDEMLALEAKAQLLHSPSSISEIAFSLGFSDPSHFSKYFKKQTGHTPAQFRQKSESDQT